MRRVTTLAIAVLVLCGLAAPALGQNSTGDRRWHGLHVSVTFGPAPGTFKIGEAAVNVANVSNLFVPTRGIVIVPGTTVVFPATNLSAPSMTRGVRAGYDWQSGVWIYGAEGGIDFGYGSASTSQSYIMPATALSHPYLLTSTRTPSADVGWSIGGRGGRQWHDMLLYGSAGLAGVHVTLDTTDTWFEASGQSAPAPSTFPLGVSNLGPLGPYVTTGHESHMVLGWTIGAGLEKPLTSTVTAGVEYRYTSLSAGTFATTNTSTSIQGPTVPGYTPGGNLITGSAFPSETSVGLSDHRVVARVTVMTPWFRSGAPIDHYGFERTTDQQWQGFHVGAAFGPSSEVINFGGSTEQFDMVTGITVPFLGLVTRPPYTLLIPASPQAAFTAVAGVHGGYDHQSGVWVIGGEGGLDFGLRSRSATLVLPIPSGDLLPGEQHSGGVETSSATVTATRVASPGPVWSAAARVGRTWNRFLLVGIIGVAGTSVSLDATDTFFSPGGNAFLPNQPCPIPGCPSGQPLVPGINLGVLGPYVATVSESHRYTGLTFGGGIEHQCNANWTTGLEYRYTNFGSQTYALANPTIAVNGPNATSGALFQGASALALPGTMTVGLSDNRLTMKMSYRFGARK